MDKTLRDLTDELIARDSKIIETEKLFRTAFCMNPLPMTLTALDGTFVKVNRALCQRVEMREEDLLGKRPADFNMYSRSEERDEIVNKLMSGEKIIGMPVSYQAGGKIISVLLSSVVVEINEVPYILSVFQEKI